MTMALPRRRLTAILAGTLLLAACGRKGALKRVDDGKKKDQKDGEEKKSMD